MNKILLVLKNEIITAVTRRSFIIMTFVFPLVAFGLFMVASQLNQSNPDALEGIFSPPSPEHIRMFFHNQYLQ